MRRTTQWTAIVIAAIALTTPQVWGSIQARVSGNVTTTAGEPIPNASVTITCPELQAFKKELKTDKKGRFKLLLLDATKTYHYMIEADGFTTFETMKKVPIGSTDNQIDFTLKSVQEALAGQQQEIRQQPGFQALEEGFGLAQQGRLEEARTSITTAVELMPDSVQAWTMLCEVEYELADYETALEHAKKCLELDDEATGCLAVAANSAQNLGRADEHAMYIGRYQQLNPDDPATVFNQAVTHLNALDDEKARPLLEQCLEIDPDFPKCLYEYGMMLLRSGDLEGAKQHLERYLEVAPEGDDAATAAETIKYL
jgi:tetratricopeptide (TPR) repeat protein